MKEAAHHHPPRVAFLCGAGGGDYLALELARRAGLVEYTPAAFVSVTENSKALQHFRSEHSRVPRLVVDSIRANREQSFNSILSLLQKAHADWVFLCGFAFLLPPALVAAFPGRIINTHHALLPDHPGLFKKEWLVGLGEERLGATVHLVDEGMDTGPILQQASFPNFGMVEFEKVLRYYRFVQDVLVVQAFRDRIMHVRGDRTTVFSDIHFVTGAEIAIIETYSNLYGFL